MYNNSYTWKLDKNESYCKIWLEERERRNDEKHYLLKIELMRRSAPGSFFILSDGKTIRQVRKCRFEARAAEYSLQKSLRRNTNDARWSSSSHIRYYTTSPPPPRRFPHPEGYNVTLPRELDIVYLPSSKNGTFYRVLPPQATWYERETTVPRHHGDVPTDFPVHESRRWIVSFHALLGTDDNMPSGMRGRSEREPSESGETFTEMNIPYHPSHVIIFKRCPI